MNEVNYSYCANEFINKPSYSSYYECRKDNIVSLTAFTEEF